jgi:hypothetical protein
MCAQYRNNALSCRVVYDWVEMFKNGSTSMNDAESLGSQTTATAAQNEKRPGKLILQNRRVTVGKIAK